MAEALYKYCNHKEPNNEALFSPACIKKVNWDEKAFGANLYPLKLRKTIVRELTNEFKNDLVRGKVHFPEKDRIFFFKIPDRSDCMLALFIKDSNLVITYYIGDTTYTHTVPVDSSDFTDKSSGKFWGKYGEVIVSLSNKLVMQIQEDIDAGTVPQI